MTSLYQIFMAFRQGAITEAQALRTLESLDIFGGFSECGEFCGFDFHAMEWIETSQKENNIWVERLPSGPFLLSGVAVN